MRVFVLLVLFQISTFCVVLGQGKHILDSLNKESHLMGCINIERSDSLALAVLNISEREGYSTQAGYALETMARNRTCEGRYQEAVELIKRSISYFRKAGDLTGEAEVLSTITSAYRKMHKIDSSLLYSKRIQEIGETTGDITLLAKGYFNQASGFIENHQQDSALFYSLEALKIAEDTTLIFLPAILHNLAISYNMSDLLGKAKKAYVRAEKAYETTRYREGLSNGIYNNMGRCYLDLGLYDSAILVYQKGMEKARNINNDFMQAYLTRGIGRAYWLKEDVDKAILYSEKSKEISRRSSLGGNLAVVLANLTRYYTAKGNYSYAIENGQEGLTLTDETHNIGIKKTLHSNLSEAYEKLGDLNNSLIHLKAQIIVEKELQEAAKSREFARLEARYETEKKEAEIASLSQRAEIQALEIRQKNQGIFLGSIGFLVMIIAVYLIYRYRENQKAHKQTELEQRFLRSQLNPHFISNALVAVQNFMLQNDSESASIYLAKFSKLMREILENSRRDFIPVEEELNMLTNFLDIHKLRLKNSFEYHINLDESIDPEEDTIPPMFVQPFVENAIEHGVIHAESKGRIELDFVKEASYIAIEVRDNGGGFVKKASGNGHTSLSSQIIQERMDLFNRTLKNKIRLVLEEIKNERGEIKGTKVELKVPFSYA